MATNTFIIWMTLQPVWPDADSHSSHIDILLQMWCVPSGNGLIISSFNTEKRVFLHALRHNWAYFNICLAIGDFSSFTLFNLKWKTIGGSLTRITWQENFFLLQFGLWTSCRMPRLAIDWYWWPNTGRGFQDGQFPWWSWPSTMINLLETKLLIGSWSEISSQLIPQKSGLVFLDLWWKINGNPNKRKSF